jgi:hypothetical protein
MIGETFEQTRKRIEAEDRALERGTPKPDGPEAQRLVARIWGSVQGVVKS